MFSGLVFRECCWLHSGNGQGRTLGSTFIHGWVEPQAVSPWFDGAIGWTLHSVKAIHRTLWSDGNSGHTPWSDWDHRLCPKIGWVCRLCLATGWAVGYDVLLYSTVDWAPHSQARLQSCWGSLFGLPQSDRTSGHALQLGKAAGLALCLNGLVEWTLELTRVSGWATWWGWRLCSTVCFWLGSLFEQACRMGSVSALNPWPDFLVRLAVG